MVLVLRKELVEIYTLLEEWEFLEDYCFKMYTDDYYNPEIFSSVYFAFLKRDSKIKANDLYDRVKNYFPEYLENLNKVKENLNGTNIEY